MESRYEKILTPLWSSEMGHRLSIARMAMGIDQKELGTRFGMTQPSISKLEKGQIRVSEIPFIVIKDSLGKHLSYVLFGSKKDSYSESTIRQKYWKTRLKRGSKYPPYRTHLEMLEDFRK